jgi:hypothetical protein
LAVERREELELAVLRHELDILRQRTKRPPLAMADQLFLTAASPMVPCAIVTDRPCGTPRASVPCSAGSATSFGPAVMRGRHPTTAR